MARSLIIFVTFLAAVLVIQAFPQKPASPAEKSEDIKQKSFNRLDRNKDGVITKKEFRKGIKAVNKAQENPDETIDNKKINGVFESLDRNKDGELNLDEFSKSGTTNRSYWWSNWATFAGAYPTLVRVGTKT